jgi:3-methyladenine DNA glycosylase AlkC
MNLKEVYSHKFLATLADAVAKVDPKFSKQKFLKNFPEKIWAQKELKQRMRAISFALEGVEISALKRVAVSIPKDKMSGLALIIFPDFIEVFGLKNFDESMAALEFFTEFGSSEFAVRQFIKLDQKRALRFFEKWSKSKNHHVRRLSSEGLRPRLPWGDALTEFKKNPAPILPILENLKHDESEYVRRSVANNLNDISKDHPQLVLDLMKRWKKEGVSKNLIKHALRTLLKKGEKQALTLIDIDCNNLSEKILIENFSLQKESVKISEDLKFDFSLRNQVSGEKIRLEYAVYFLKQNGTYTKKIFQITTKNFAEGVFIFSKKHSFRDLTTRKHYAGKHLISLVVNGSELEKIKFYLEK